MTQIEVYLLGIWCKTVTTNLGVFYCRGKRVKPEYALFLAPPELHTMSCSLQAFWGDCSWRLFIRQHLLSVNEHSSCFVIILLNNNWFMRNMEKKNAKDERRRSRNEQRWVLSHFDHFLMCQTLVSWIISYICPSITDTPPLSALVVLGY